jgi:hypothetical protein
MITVLEGKVSKLGYCLPAVENASSTSKSTILEQASSSDASDAVPQSALVP